MVDLLYFSSVLDPIVKVRYIHVQARIQDFSQGGVRFNKILLYAREARIK